MDSNYDGSRLCGIADVYFSKLTGQVFNKLADASVEACGLAAVCLHGRRSVQILSGLHEPHAGTNVTGIVGFKNPSNLRFEDGSNSETKFELHTVFSGSRKQPGRIFDTRPRMHCCDSHGYIGEDIQNGASVRNVSVRCALPDHSVDSVCRHGLVALSDHDSEVEGEMNTSANAFHMKRWRHWRHAQNSFSEFALQKANPHGTIHHARLLWRRNLQASIGEQQPRCIQRSAPSLCLRMCVLSQFYRLSVEDLLQFPSKLLPKPIVDGTDFLNYIRLFPLLAVMHWLSQVVAEAPIVRGVVAAMQIINSDAMLQNETIQPMQIKSQIHLPQIVIASDGEQLAHPYVLLDWLVVNTICPLRLALRRSEQLEAEIEIAKLCEHGLLHFVCLVLRPTATCNRPLHGLARHLLHVIRLAVHITADDRRWMSFWKVSGRIG